MAVDERLGKYQLLKKINTGGMAEIFLAIQSSVEGFEKLTAIKRILPHLSDNQEFISMFIDEAKLAAQLTHPNIVHIYDFGKIDNAYYIAMEYLAGKNLKEIVKRCREKKIPFTTTYAMLIIRSACKALDYAHRKRDLNNELLNIVHRDVSPQNILVSYEGEVKVVDFGIAKAALHSQETRVGVLKGKLAYMSPEQALGKKVDRRADIFSLGIVLYELLTGTRLFKGDSEVTILDKVRSAEVEPLPRALNPKIPPALEQVVLKALARNPEDRYQSAGQMQQAMEKVLQLGRESDTSMTLHAFMNQLFAEQIAQELQELRGLLENLKGVDVEKTMTLSMSQVGPVAGKESATQAGAQQSAGSGLKKWLGAALAILVLAGLGILYKRGISKQSGLPLAIESEGGAPQLMPQAASETGIGGAGVPLLPASLKIIANVSGADIFLDGEKHGQSSSEGQAVLIAGISPLEEHTITLSKDDYLEWEESFSLDSGQEYLLEPRLQSLYVNLQLSSQPAGAQVFLDGEKLEGKVTPVVIDSLLLDETHTVSLHKKGYAAWRKDFTPQEGDESLFEEVQLQRLYGKLKLDSQPPGAQIVIYGHPLGNEVTPAVIDGLIPGKQYTVSLRKEGYAVWQKKFTVQEGKTLSFTGISLERLYGTLTINSVPWSEVYLENKKLGVTPLAGLKLPTGRHELKLVNSTVGINEILPVQIEFNQVNNQMVRFEGSLNLNVLPWAEVYIDEEKSGVTPLAGIKLIAGVHQIRVVNSALNQDREFKVLIKPNRTTSKIVNLQAED